MSDDLDRDFESDPLDAPDGGFSADAAPRIWTPGRIIGVLLAVAMLGVTIGVYLMGDRIDESIIEPRKIAAICVFAIVGGIGYRLSGKLGERLLVVIAALSAAAVVVMYVSGNPGPSWKAETIHMGFMLSQGLIAVVFVLAGLCIFGGWIYFGFFRKHPSSTAPTE